MKDSAAQPGHHESLLRLAYAIVAPGWRAQFLKPGPNGKKDSDGFVDIAKAVASQRSFMVKARNDILVIDNDVDVDGVHVPDFLDEYAETFDELLPVLCASGGEGRFHVFIPIPDHQLRDRVAGLARSFGFRDVTPGRWIRPPLAPHPSGGRSELVNMTAEHAAEILSPRTSLPGRLGGRALRALLTGSTGPSDSEALMSATLGMVVNGWDENEMFPTLLRYPGGRSLQARLETRPVAWVKAWWEKHTLKRARERAACSPTVRSKSDAQLTIAGVRAWWQVHAWKGRAGATDRVVLGYLLDVAEEIGRTHELGASVRQIAEGAGLGHHATATRSLHRLIDQGIIKRLAREESLNPKGYKGPLAHRYSFTVPPHLSEVEAQAWGAAVQAARMHQSDPGACETATGATRRDARSPAGHDAFRHGGISKSAFKVWEALTDSPVSLRDLSTRLGYKRPDSMRRLLAVLAHHGLAAKADDGWRRLTPDLDVLARDLGTSGKGEAQQKLHGAQRARAAAKVGTTDDRSTASRFVMQELIEDPAGRLAVDELQRAYFRWFDTLKSGRPERSNAFRR